MLTSWKTTCVADSPTPPIRITQTLPKKATPVRYPHLTKNLQADADGCIMYRPSQTPSIGLYTNAKVSTQKLLISDMIKNYFVRICYYPGSIKIPNNILCLVQDNFLTQHVLEPTRAARVLDIVNDCIATQRCPTPEILIASPVISRTTSEPSGGRSRMMAAIVAGCCSVRTFRDCHNSIAFTIGLLH